MLNPDRCPLAQFNCSEIVAIWRSCQEKIVDAVRMGRLQTLGEDLLPPVAQHSHRGMAYVRAKKNPHAQKGVRDILSCATALRLFERYSPIMPETLS